MSNHYVNTFSAVIQLNEGIISKVIWDNRCSACSGAECSTCDKDNCYQVTFSDLKKDAVCTKDDCLTTNSPDCDPKVNFLLKSSQS